jgi:hypothetical protein
VMKLKPNKVTVVAFAVSGVGVLLAIGIIYPRAVDRVADWLPPVRKHRLISRAQPIPPLLESYRQEHGRYPESLASAGISEPEEIYYQHEADGSYVLWFGMELGESVVFRSTTRKWE